MKTITTLIPSYIYCPIYSITRFSKHFYDKNQGKLYIDNFFFWGGGGVGLPEI